MRVVVDAMNHHRLRALAEFIYRNLASVTPVTFMEIKGYVKKNLNRLWIDRFDYQKELIQAVQYFDLVGMNLSVDNHQLCMLDRSLCPSRERRFPDWQNMYLFDT